MNQLDFDTLGPGFASDSERLLAAGARIVELVRDICEYHRHKVVAAALGRSPASLSQALREDRDQRNGHSLKLHELPWFLANAHSNELSDYLGSLREPPASKSEQLIALSGAAIEYLGAEVHKGLLSKARTKLVANRRKKVG